MRRRYFVDESAALVRTSVTVGVTRSLCYPNLTLQSGLRWLGAWLLHLSGVSWLHPMYDFEKERWRRGEADSHPLDRDIYPPENGDSD